MRNFQDTFETRKPSFISAFLICMTLPLKTPTKIQITLTDMTCIQHQIDRLR